MPGKFESLMKKILISNSSGNKPGIAVPEVDQLPIVHRCKSWPWCKDDERLQYDTGKLPSNYFEYYDRRACTKNKGKEKSLSDDESGPGIRLEEKLLSADEPRPGSGSDEIHSDDESRSGTSIMAIRARSKARIESLRAKARFSDKSQSPFWKSRINAVLNQTCPIEDDFPEFPRINEAYVPFLEQVNKGWLASKTSPRVYEIVTELIRKAFRGAEEPFYLALYMITKADDIFKNDTNTLAMHMLREFKKWLGDGIIKIRQLNTLNNEVRQMAFRISSMQGQQEFCKIVCETFQLSQIGEELIISIRDLCSWGLYKEACHFAKFLEIYDKFDIHEFVVPLILQDRETAAYPYLIANVPSRKSLVSFIKSMLNTEYPNKALQLYVSSEKIRLVKMEKLHPVHMVKLLGRLDKTFKEADNPAPKRKDSKEKEKDKEILFKIVTFDSDKKYDECPKTTRTDAAGQSKNARVGKTTQPPKAIGPNPTKESELGTSQSARQGEKSAVAPPKAQKGAKKSVEPSGNSKSAHVVESKSKSTSSVPRPVSGPSVITPTTPEIYSSFVKPRTITNVSTPDGVKNFMNIVRVAQIVQRQAGRPGSDLLVVSIDIKFKYEQMTYIPNHMIVLLRDEVFILDIISLDMYIDERQKIWEVLLHEFLNNWRVLKIGLGMGRIFQALYRICSRWFRLKSTITMFLDLGNIADMIMNTVGNFFPYPKGPSLNYKLGELVLISIGKQMNRAENASNWADRPLTEAQIDHSINEVCALMDVFGFMRTRSWVLKFDFETLATNILSRVKRPNFVFQLNPFRTLQRPGDIKVVCDKMFQKLGKQLRISGIDTSIVDKSELYVNCVSEATCEGRFIITTPEYIEEMSQIMPPAFCFAVTATMINQQVRQVLQYFHITIKEEDFFTRCEDCNGDRFIEIENKRMKKLMENNLRPVPIVDRDETLRSPTYISLKESTLERRTKRKWKLLPASVINPMPENIRTSTGVSIYFYQITSDLLDADNFMFFVCDGCAKVYCEGTPLSLRTSHN